MASHSSTLAWKIPRMEEPGGLQSMGSLGVGHDWATSLSLFTFHALEKEMATHSSVLAWRIPGMGEPGGLPSMGSHRVGHDWSDLAAVAATDHCFHPSTVNFGAGDVPGWGILGYGEEIGSSGKGGQGFRLGGKPSRWTDAPFAWTHPATMVSGCDGQKEKEASWKMPTLAAGKMKPRHCEDPWHALKAGVVVPALGINNKRLESSMSYKEWESGTLLYF